MRIVMNMLIAVSCSIVGSLLFSEPLHAQAIAAAKGPGSYVSMGVALSGFEQGYGRQYGVGQFAYLDANAYRRIGVEAEVEKLDKHMAEGEKSITILVGAKISSTPHSIRPYVKLLAGRGTLTFPFHYATGSYFVVTAGAGVDWRVGHTRLLLRVFDAEYQEWRNFSFGELHQYGSSMGVSYELFTPSSRPAGRHF